VACAAGMADAATVACAGAVSRSWAGHLGAAGAACAASVPGLRCFASACRLESVRWGGAVMPKLCLGAAVADASELCAASMFFSSACRREPVRWCAGAVRANGGRTEWLGLTLRWPSGEAA
jgi:hypothetical protein